MYKRNIKAESCKNFYSVKAINIMHNESVLLLPFVIQHPQRMLHIILSSVAYPTVPYVFELSHKRQNFLGGGGGEVTEHKMCFYFHYTFVSNNFRSKKNSFVYDHKCLRVFM